ncbi:Sorbin and SH3 domain-containing protein 2 [Entophlyctis luteolus]|nr:Sorbin and SH3 domain-containing protein 2 [Entophlyctis luteolus]
MSLSFDLNNDSGSFGSSMRSTSVYNCPNWDGTGLRYYKSSWCMYFIASGITTVADSTNATCSTAASAPLCLTTWDKFETSWTSTLSSTTFCPSGESSLAQTLSSLYSGLNGVMSTATTCTVSLASETANCGFNTAAEASAFCSTTTVSAESCCATVTTAAKTTAAAVATTANVATSVAGGASSSSIAAMVASSSAAAAAVAASSSSSSSGSVSIPVIAGAAGGVAALLIIVAVIFCCVRRKKRQNESMPEKDFSTAYGMKNDKQPFSSQGAGMGYGNPPVNSMAPSHEPQMCEAVYDYTANLPDELTAIVGDKVIVKIEYDDGWGFGYNTRTRKEGTFPLDILDKFQNGDQGYNDGNRTTRASSMYGPGGNTNNKNNNGANSYYDTNNGTESVYYAQSEYNTNSVYAPAGGGSTVHEAAYDFTPEQPDEIELRVGDRVELKQQYDDGWALGRNLAINKEGLFPLDCLAGFDGPQQFDAQGNKKHNNRVSSMYGTESQYGPQSMYGGNSSYYEGGTQSYYGTGNGQDSVYYGQ